MVGVAVGIAIADLLVAWIGTGTWQIGVVTGLAMLGATLVGGGALLASQAGVSAVLVATLQPPETAASSSSASTTRSSAARVALIVSCLVFPVDPVRLVRERSHAGAGLLRERAGADREGAGEPRARGRRRGALAVGRVDGAHEGLIDALDGAGEAARLSPRRRGRFAGRLERHAVAAGELGRAIENVRALARGAIRAINLGDSVPDDAIRATRELGRCVLGAAALPGGRRPKPMRAAAVRASGLANKVLEETGNLSAVHIVGQIRLAAVDLLRASGLDRDEAQDAVRTATAPTRAARPQPPAASPSADGG